ncbi:MAG: alpha-galactosidase [Dokdonella sp.]
MRRSRAPSFAAFALAALAGAAETGGAAGTAVIAQQAVDAEPASIRIGNRDATLEMRAEPSSPRVLRLASAGTDIDGAAAVALIDHVEIDGVAQPLQWRFSAAASRIEPAAISLVYESVSPPLCLYWEWQARSQHGPLEHAIRIENRGTRELWLPLQDSFSASWKIPAQQPLQQLWVDKGAGKAPAIGTHLADVADGYRWRGTSSPFAHPFEAQAQPREIIPYLLLRSAQENDAKGWYLGVEFSGRVAMELQRHGDMLEVRAGLDAQPGPFRTRLPPGASFVTPTIFLGATRGSIDDAGNALRRWVRDVLNDPRSIRNPAYPLLTNNSWGSGMAIDAAQARRMIDDSQALGFEMFHLDAGWFRGVGDWHPDPQKFPQGLAAVSAYAHRKGLKFGLWTDWTQAGVGTQPGALAFDDPHVRGWLTTDPPPGWKPAAFKGITIDLGQPAAKAWASQEVDRIVRDFDLDMLEHDGYIVAQGCDRSDHPHATCDPHRTHRYVDEEFIWLDGPNSSDVSYHAARAYYAIHEKLKRDHPGLLLEICNDGGRMVDFGSAAHGDYFSIVDSYDPVSNRQAFYDASHVLPQAMLETYVKEWPTPSLANFRYMLRSGMMGWFTLMLDTTRWSRAQREAARAELRMYKSTLRPLIRAADLYHVAPRADERGWDGIEYVDARRGEGVVYAFRGAQADASAHTFLLKGLRAEARYRVRFRDASAADFTRSGDDLMRDGVRVALPEVNSSELILLTALR